MTNRKLVVQVTVVEKDQDGNILSRLCEHSEAVPLPEVLGDAEQVRQDYCHWAYQGFNLARNGPLGLGEPAPGVPRLSLLVLKTPQLEVVRAFYAALGVSFTKEQHGDGPRHYAGQLGPVVLEVYPLRLQDGTTAEPVTRLGFGVDDLAAVMDSLQALGTPVISPLAANRGIRAIVRDPAGRTVELSEWPKSLR